MDDQQKQLPPENMPKLTLLKVLCVFTFIGSGFLVFSYSVIGFAYDYFSQHLDLIPDQQNRELIEMLLSGGRLFFILCAILYACSFIGALLMWRMHKVGFHFYTASQLFLLILPMVFIKGYPMSGPTIVITFVFIWGYGMFLKVMN